MFVLSRKHTSRRKLISKCKDIQVYFTIHPTNKARGSTAVIVRNELKHHEEIKYQTEAIQATSVKV